MASITLMDDVKEYFSLAGSVLFYTIVLPIVKLLRVLVFILSPLFYVLQFLLLPLTYIIGFILTIVGIPFRLEVRTRIETVYIFVGVAITLGVIAALGLQTVVMFISSSLGLNTQAEEDVPRKRDRARRSSRKVPQPQIEDDMDSSDAAAVARGYGSQKHRSYFSRAMPKDD